MIKNRYKSKGKETKDNVRIYNGIGQAADISNIS